MIVSLLLAVKLEQPKKVDYYDFLSKLLTESERKQMPKEALLELERKVLIQLGFDMCRPGPVQSLERFIRILNCPTNPKLYGACVDILKMQLQVTRFLKYKPSMVSACALILALNSDQESSC